MAAQILISPFHIVTLDRDDGEVRFSTPEPEPQFGHVQATATGTAVSSLGCGGRAHERRSDYLPTTAHDQDSGPRPCVLDRADAAGGGIAGVSRGTVLRRVALWSRADSGFVRFHAWQALFGLGALGTAAIFFLASAFVLLIVSPTAFWVMLWLAAIACAVWVVVWGLCLWNAYHGHVWKLPYAGDYAARYASHS